MNEKLKRGFVKNRARRSLGVALTLGTIGLLFGALRAPVIRRSSAQAMQTINLSVGTSDSGCIVPYENYSIRFNDITLTTKGTDITRDLQINSGRNVIRVSVPGKPDVMIDRVVVGTSEENKRTYPAASKDGVKVDFDGLDQPTVYVYLSGLCTESSENDDKERDVKLLLYSTNCETPDWSGVTLTIGDLDVDAESSEEILSATSSKPYGRWKRFEITPGRKEIRISSTSFPMTSIEWLQIVKNLKLGNGEWTMSAGSRSRPDAAGKLSIDLHRGLWESSKRFEGLSMLVGVMGNCEDPTFNADSFGRLTVKAISGDVEVEYRFLKPPFNRANPGVGSTLRRGAVIKTGKDGLIVLESEYKHTVTIDSSTQVRFDDLMSTTGRRQLTAFIEKGKIKIDRKGRDLQDAPRTAVQTDTATVGSVNTIYDVSYDPSSKLTTVNVDEGDVEVIPANETLESVRLSANQQLQVSDTKITKGTSTWTLLLYVGIGVGGLIVLVVTIFVLYLILRAAKPTTPRFAVQGNAGRQARGWRRPRLRPGYRLCPNPHCHAVQPVNTNFCGVCGSTFQ